MLKMVDGTGIIGVDMICPLGVSTPQPPNYDRVEMEGTGMLVLPNSLDAPLEGLELGGKTAQVQTSGKNLANPSEFVVGTLAGDTGNIIGLKQYISTGYIPAIPGKRYSTSCGNKFLAHTIFAYDKEKTKINSAINMSSEMPEGAAYIRLSYRKIDMTNVTESDMEELKKVCMVNEGSTVLSYEQYTGGKPSPSPEYPQAIKNVGKWNEEKQKYEVDVKVTGKNLFDAKKAKSGWITPDGKQTLVALGSVDNVVSDYIQVYPGMNYTSSASVFQNFYDSEKNFLNHITNASTSIVVPDNAKYMIVVIAVNKALVIQTANTLMINIGSSRTDFESYKEQTLTITSDRPITKWDRLVEQGGQIGWLYKSREVNFTGEESWKRHTETDMSVWFACYNCLHGIKTHNVTQNIGVFNNYALWSKEIVDDRVGKFCTNGNLSNNFFLAGMPKDYTVETFKAWLREKNEYGKPMRLTYETETTEFIPLPEKEQNAIRALKTYYPTTVITADGGELYPDIKVTYRKEK